MSAVQNNKDIKTLLEEVELLKKELKELKSMIQAEKVKKPIDNKKGVN